MGKNPNGAGTEHPGAIPMLKWEAVLESSSGFSSCTAPSSHLRR